MSDFEATVRTSILFFISPVTICGILYSEVANAQNSWQIYFQLMLYRSGNSDVYVSITPRALSKQCPAKTMIKFTMKKKKASSIGKSSTTNIFKLFFSLICQTFSLRANWSIQHRYNEGTTIAKVDGIIFFTKKFPAPYHMNMIVGNTQQSMHPM